MLEAAIGWAGGILITVNIVVLVVLDVLRIFMWIKCFKVKRGCCHNRGCRWRDLCTKYDSTIEMLDFRIAMLEEWIRQKEEG